MTYGKDARVGNLIVFSREGAIDKYKTICKVCNKYGTMESSIVQSNAMLDMFKLGFTPDEVEQIEISTYNK